MPSYSCILLLATPLAGNSPIIQHAHIPIGDEVALIRIYLFQSEGDVEKTLGKIENCVCQKCSGIDLELRKTH